MKKEKLLTDEELDQVVGGTTEQTYSLCSDLNKNNYLRSQLNKSELRALENILQAGPNGNMATSDTLKIQSFLADKLQLDAVYLNEGVVIDDAGYKGNETITVSRLSALITAWGK